MKKLVIFDFDGTLFDSVEDVIICFDKTLEIHDFPKLTRKEYFEVLGGNIDEMVSLILRENNTSENIELIKNTYEKLYDESKKENTLPFPKMHDLLNVLQEKDLLLAINSNRKTDSIKYYVDKFFMDVDFVSIEGHNPNHPSKPHPYAVEMMRKKFDVTKDECIYIGDSKTDINTANNAEIDCLIVKWGYGTQEDYNEDNVLGVIGNPDEILNYF